ncbi:hypothetical protein KY328_02565 [Candidatus Woesearchaeota archaeon]|nr:hypothetical protein [Candidatus Woesearchaeota archaeon]
MTDEWFCPKGHGIPLVRDAYCKIDTNCLDADGRAMYEEGLFCHYCDNGYSLKDIRQEKVSEDN